MKDPTPRQDILIPGIIYTVGVGDKEFPNAIYIGEGYAFNKPMFKFKTENNQSLSINPSFHSWIREEDNGKD